MPADPIAPDASPTGAPAAAQVGPSAASSDIGSRFAQADASPGFLLWQVATVWQRRIRAVLEQVGLTHAQFVLLASTGWLEDHANGVAVTQAQIADHARTDAVMTSEVLRTLERKGLVRRLRHPSDARARQLAVTEQGRDLVRSAIALVETVDDEFFGKPTPELTALARAIGAVWLR